MPRHGRTALTLLTLSVPALAGCAGTGPMSAPEIVSIAHTDNSAGPERALVDPTDPAAPRGGPAAPVRGQAYPYDLYTHCGLEFARFGGRTWRVTPARPEPLPRADAAGVETYTGYTAGTMTLMAPAVARFVMDARRVVVTGSPVILFTPTAARPPICR
ncbi:hypothetical protein GCM10010123_11990 [Pilimelia anulata]|uniref:Uncharacterized protein n=1 Tax=Pilimelia anulata TaxID=53371 RepID=A0A8J3B0P3_9ACTN|nr:hypothetical protein [Pilimelia anulata]GGJ83907.1 hypothetical protein GCM10010123_11990 [Pilimelia anulata]